jgi:hypothetical protein
MSIQDSEIIWRKSEENSNAGTNGGRMTSVVSTSEVKNNIFPDVKQSDRTAGLNQYRKLHLHIANAEDLTLVAPKVMVENYTGGDDAVAIAAGTHIDQESGLSSPRLYGCGQLKADASAAATTLTVVTENSALDYFQTGDTVRISDMSSLTAGAGNEQYLVLSAVSVYTGDEVTLTFTSTPLDFPFTAADTRVASVYLPGDSSAGYDTPVVTSAGTGDYDFSNATVHNVGAIADAITLTLTNASTVSVVGAQAGSLGSFPIGSDIAPTNPDYASAYFTLASAGFSGVWQAGDTITFNTTPNAIPLWYYQSIPALSGSLTGNQVVVGIEGESS